MDAREVQIEWHPDMSIYAAEPFLKAVSDDYGWLGGFDQAERLRCILPYTIVRKAFVRLARFRTETIPIEEDIDVAHERRFLDSAMEHLRSLGADMVIPASTNTLFRTYPDGAIAAPYGSYVVDLLQPEEVLWCSMSASHRRKIRVARRNGVQIRCGLEHWRTAHACVRDTFRRSKMPFMSEDAFRRFVESMGDNVRILIAEHDGSVQASIVVPFSLHAGYYVYGGGLPKPASGATNLLHWEAMRMFRDLGVRQYDFSGGRIRPARGSKQEGLMQFKQRFGGQLNQGYMWKYHFSFLGSAAYTVAIRLTRGGDIVDRERHKLQKR